MTIAPCTTIIVAWAELLAWRMLRTEPRRRDGELRGTGRQHDHMLLIFERPDAAPRRIFRETARFKVRPPRDFHPRHGRGALRADMRLPMRNLQSVPTEGRHRSAAP